MLLCPVQLLLLRGAMRDQNQGLGLVQPGSLENTDDEYDAYRKRMMLAYRFRPNPLVGIHTIFCSLNCYMVHN